MTSVAMKITIALVILGMAAASVIDNSRGREPRCLTEPNPGECRGAFPRFFYNATSDQCDCFLYGGCGEEAIQSSWLSLTECNDVCQPGLRTEGPRCTNLPEQNIQRFPAADTILEPLDVSHLGDQEFLDFFQNN